jgi:hypothetical protein
MILYGYDMYKNLLIVNRNLTKEWFLEKAGIRSGYARDMFSRLYDSIFKVSENVEELYHTYYSLEYFSFEEFLLKWYDLKKEYVDEILKALHEHKEWTIIAYDSLAYGENVDDFFFSENLYKRIEKLLLMTI